MASFAKGYIQPGVYTQVINQTQPIFSAGGFTPALIGTGSIYKNVAYTIQRGTVAGTPGSLVYDLIIDQNNSNVLRETIGQLFSIVDNVGQSYLINQDFTLSFDATTGAGTIVWGYANQPAPSTVQSVTTYTVTMSVMKTNTDYNSVVLSDLTSFLSYFGPIEHATVPAPLTVTKGINGGSDIFAASGLTLNIYNVLQVADASNTVGTYYALGRDYNVYTGTTTATGTGGGGASTTTILTAAAVSGWVGQYVRLTTGTGDATNNGLLRKITSVSVGVSATFDAVSAVTDNNNFTIFSLTTTPALGQNNTTSSIVLAGSSSTFIIDWSPSLVNTPSGKEPTASASYTLYYESTTGLTDASLYTLSIAYNLLSNQGTSVVVASQFNPLNNGAGTVVVTADKRGPNGFYAPSSLATAYQTALTNALNNQLFLRTDVQIIVPLLAAHLGSASGPSGASTYSFMLTQVRDHCLSASSVTEGRPRFAIMGAPVTTDAATDAVGIYTNTCQGINSDLVTYISATSFLTNNYDFGTKSLDGSFIAAMVAGVNANPNFDAAEPMSGKQLVVNGVINDIFSKYQKNVMAGAGGCVVDNENGNVTIRDFVTTDSADVLGNTGEVPKITMVVRTTLQVSLKALYINTRNLGPETYARITSTCNQLLQGFVNQNILRNFNVVSVVTDPTDARQINVTLSVQPTLSIKWIYLTLNVNI